MHLKGQAGNGGEGSEGSGGSEAPQGGAPLETERPDSAPQGGSQEAPTADQPEMVDLHEADTASVKAALAEAVRAEQALADTEGADGEPQQGGQLPPKQPSGQTARAQAPQQTAPQGASNAAPPTSPTAASNGSSASNGQAPSADAETERINKQRANKELYIQRRGGELQAVRTQFAGKRSELEAARARLAANLEAKAAENPLAAIEDRERIKEIERKLEDLDRKESRAELLVESESLFLRNIDTEKVSLDDMVELLRSRGVPENSLAQFRASPYEFMPAESLIEIGHHVETRKAYQEADKDRIMLARYVIQLEKENSQLKAKPRQVMQQVQRKLNQPRDVGPQSSVGVRSSQDLDPTRMSRAELKAAIKNAQLREGNGVAR